MTLLRFLLPLGMTCLPLAAQKIDVEFDESADFSNYKTFSLRDGSINSKAPALNNDLVRRNLETNIRTNLQARGLTEVTQRPDLNVRYSLGSGQRREVDTFPAGWRGMRTRRVVTQTTEGTLVIDLRDAAKRELVWRAVATENERDPSKLKEKLDDMVKKAMGKYPPKK